MVRSLIGLSINNHRNLKPTTIEYAIILTNDTIKSDPENSFRTIEIGNLHPIVPSIGRSYCMVACSTSPFGTAPRLQLCRNVCMSKRTVDTMTKTTSICKRRALLRCNITITGVAAVQVDGTTQLWTCWAAKYKAPSFHRRRRHVPTPAQLPTAIPHFKKSALRPCTNRPTYSSVYP
jgi:hypothetical protein